MDGPTRADAPVAYGLFAAIAVAALAPIRSYDFFWHLATGRWIIEHRALPLFDPFAVGTDRVPWINGEWLFEVVLYPLQRAIGFGGLSIVRALVVAAIFAIAFRAARGTTTALIAAAIGFAGANRLLDMRPALLAPLFVVAIIALAERSWIVIAVVTALWMNVHPSALLAPLIVLVVSRSIPKTFASFVALFVNPFGWRAVAAPIALTAFAGGGAFVNAEWLPSDPRVFPLLYLTIVIVAIAYVRAPRQLWQVVLFAIFALLAIRHVRNQPLYFAALPLLVPPLPLRRASAATGAVFIAWVLVFADHSLGVAQHRWPVSAVARLKATALKGNIYNPDQFGGFLIWSFYPERRALTDGRNELSHTYIREYAVARVDSRAWSALLRKYRIDLAVDEYRPGGVPVTDMATHQQRILPASLVYWPRTQWALVAFDDVGMVFARRAAFAPDVLSKWELRGVVPDEGK